MAVAVRVFKIFCTKDNRFSTLGYVIKMNVFSDLYEGAEILFTVFQTHRIRFCCQNFDTIDNSLLIPVEARNLHEDNF